MSAICDAHKKVGVELLYNSVHRKLNQLEIRCSKENQHPERLGPQAPGWAAQENRKRNAIMARRVGVNMLQFCSVSNSLSHSKTLSNPFEPFQIKWEVYFSKELCRSSLLYRLYDSACICIWVCNNAKSCFYFYIRYIWFVNRFCWYKQLNDQTVLYLTIHFSISHSFAFSLNVKLFYLTHR